MSRPTPRLSVVALDCPDPDSLIRFYSELTGWPLAEGDTDDDWRELVADGPVTIACQQVGDYRAPQWPQQEHPQQLHLDFDVPDLDAGEEFVLGVGATKADVQPGETFRVYTDPVGHPFCLVLAT
ncbi:glyoxalase [Pseudonocardia sulfidoxydans NBRC 16205]|uniref:Glyoxalase n=1 Tax=Pseudonocardia sulfidoxydans NBRC 16205 TaxID=1223511 RepID=A0A511DII8_9PSEU|nr:VOC family protein [Pseudonocardia sulfidoxydans]GEL24615.1 glyoxalase [Pseudonocardia sulfidoxydans NBRC 16205]